MGGRFLQHEQDAGNDSRRTELAKEAGPRARFLLLVGGGECCLQWEAGA